jgi:hypothetical protein
VAFGVRKAPFWGRKVAFWGRKNGFLDVQKAGNEKILQKSLI